MASPFCRVIPGQFVIVGEEPDGDSMGVVVADLRLYKAPRNNYRIKPNKQTRSVQLRCTAVDAPEVH